MADSEPKVVVVILNYNGLQLLKDCLISLESTLYSNYEILVVDNASTDGSREYLLSNKKPSHLLLDKNLGFSGGNNAGMREAIQKGAKYIVLVNNDIKVEPNWLRAMIDAFQSDEKIALCASKVLNWEGNLIEFAGTSFDPLTTAGGYLFEPDDGRYSRSTYAAYPCGASMGIRASVLSEVGFFDDRYFIYNDDVDLGLRCWIAGHSVVYVADSIIYHLYGGGGMPSVKRERMAMRNALITVMKNYELRTIINNFPYLLDIYWKTNRQHIKQAALDAFKMLPGTLLRRIRLQCKRKRSDKELFGILAQALAPDGLNLVYNCDRGSCVVGEVCGATTYGQSFICPQDNLCRIDISMATYARKNTGVLLFHLRTAPTGEDILQIPIDVGEIQDNAYLPIPFTPVHQAAGKVFYFFLEAAEAVNGNAVTMWFDSRKQDNTMIRYVNHQPVRGCLKFRVFCGKPKNESPGSITGRL